MVEEFIDLAWQSPRHCSDMLNKKPPEGGLSSLELFSDHAASVVTLRVRLVMYANSVPSCELKPIGDRPGLVQGRAVGSSDFEQVLFS